MINCRASNWSTSFRNRDKMCDTVSLDVPDKRDIKIQDEDVVRLTDGTRFFTAPGRINPGAQAVR